MKKLLFIALVGTFVACGEATEATEPTEQAVEAPTETVIDTVAVVDTTVVVDTTAAPAPAQ